MKMKMRVVVFGLALNMASATAALHAATVTGFTGSSQPYTNMQPSMALHALIAQWGPLDRVGEVRLFAGRNVPEATFRTDGSLQPISEYEPMFHKLGTAYGGDGEVTFAMPDLRGRLIVHSGTGSGLTQRPFATSFGTGSVAVGVPHLPAHRHGLVGGYATDSVGTGQPLTNVQPSLGLNYQVALQGIYPSPEGGSYSSSEPMLGQVSISASHLQMTGYAFANGQLLSTNQNQALYSLLNNTYGGAAPIDFALPDLRGRTAVHTSNVPGKQVQLGQRLGSETVTLTEGNLPSHTHSLSGGAGPTTDATGSGQAFSNLQASLGLNYIICLSGSYPTQIGELAVTGEVRLFAGNFAPGGWAFAQGQLLPLSQNSALYSVLGTTYGGDGKSTFALPDLRGKAVIGTGAGPGQTYWQLGQTYGIDNVTLTESNLPAHQHFVASRHGDADHDEDVDFNDLLTLARHYGQTSGQRWETGDFTADGGVTFDDLLALARQYGFGTRALTQSQVDLLGETVAADWALAQSLVPEPSIVCALGAAGAVVGRRRRTQRTGR